MQEESLRVKRRPAVTGETLVSGALTSLARFQESGDDEAWGRFQKRYGALDELARLNNDGVGMEARRVVSDLNAYMDWVDSGDDTLRPKRLFGKEGGLLQRATSTRSWLTGRAASDAYPITEDLANYLPDVDQPHQRYLRAMLQYESPFQGASWEDGTFHVEHSDFPERVTVPFDELWEMWPRVRASLLDYRASQMPGAAAFAQGAGVATTVLDKGTRLMTEAISGNQVPPEVGPTARPGSEIRYFPMGREGEWLGGWTENDLMQSPRYTRAYEMVASLLQLNGAAQSGDEDALTAVRQFESATGIEVPDDATLDKGVLENALFAGGLIFDVSAGSGALRTAFGGAKGAMAALGLKASAPVAVAGQSVAAATNTIQPSVKAATVGGRFTPPWFLRGTLSVVADLTAYDVLRSGLGLQGSPDTALGAAKEGALEGLSMGVFNMGFRALRRGVGRLLTDRRAVDGIANALQGTLPKASDALRKMRSKAVAAERAARQFTGTGIPSVDYLIEMLPAEIRRGNGVAKAVHRLGMNAGKAAAFGAIIDSYALGSAMGAYADARSDPEWDRLDGVEKIGRIMRGFTSADALGQGLGFAMAPVLSMSRFRWDPAKEIENFPELQRAEVEGLLRQTAEVIANPEPRQAKRYLELFNEIEKVDPGFFGELEYRDPATAEAQKAWAESPFVSVQEARQILEANRAEPRYEGFTPWQIVRDVMEHGGPMSEQQRVDIGLDIAPDFALEDMTSWSRGVADAVGFLKLGGVLEPGVTYAQDITTAKLHALAREDASVRQKMELELGKGGYELAVTSARNAIAYARSTANNFANEEGGSRASAVSAMLAYTSSETEAAPDYIVDVLKKTGLVDADGVLVGGARASMSDWLDWKMSEAAETRGGQQHVEALARLNAGLAFGDSRWGSTKESTRVRLSKTSTLSPVLRKVLPNWIYKGGISRLFTLGQWSQNFRTEIERDIIKSWVERVKEPRDWKQVAALMRAQDTLQRVASMFGGKNIPRAHTELLRWAIESGAWRKMKGPESFEKNTPGTGYLFEFARDITDAFGQAARRGVLEGWLAPEQARKYFQRYVPHLKIDAEREARHLEEQRQGQITIPFAGRNIARQGTARGTITTRLDDPFYYLRRTVAQESQQIEFFGLLSDTIHGGYAIGEAEFRALAPEAQAEYDPVTTDPAEGKAGLFFGWNRGPSNRMHRILSQLEEQYEAGAESGRRPFTPKMRELIDSYMGRSKKGQMFLPRGIMAEFDVALSQIFNPPSPDRGLWKSAVEQYEQAWRFVRRGLTILRPKHWMLNVGNSIGTNHLFDVVPATDWLGSWLTGEGYYADAFSDLTEFMRVGGGRSLRDVQKPEDMPIAQWDRLRMLERAAEQLGNGTWVTAGVETQSIVDVLSSVGNADNVSEALRQQLRDGDYGTLEQIDAATTDIARRMKGGLEGFDARVHELFGSPDPAERAAAVAQLTSLYQTWEMAFKWAGALRLMDVNPNISVRRAITMAAKGTADYRNTHPAARQWNTSRSVLFNPTWKATDSRTRRAVGAVAREVLRGHFWMYENTMLLPKIHAAFVGHPVKALAIGAVTGSIAAGLHQLATSDDENVKDELSYQLELWGSLNQPSPPRALDQATRTIMERAFPDASMPDVTGSLSVDQDEQPRKLLHRILSGEAFMFEAPSRGDKTMVSTLEPFAPGTGDVSRMYRMLGESQEEFRTDPAYAAMSWVGLRLATGSALAAHGIAGLFRGDKTMRDKAALFTKEASRLLPVLHVTSPLSLEAVRFAEVTGTDGHGFGDWLRGIRASQKQTANEQWGDLFLSGLWTSRSILQVAPLRPERNVGDALLERIYPEFRHQPLQVQNQIRFARSVLDRQIAQTMTDAYAEFNGWARGTFTYGGLLVNRLSEVEEFIATTDPELREHSRDLWQAYLSSSEWGDLAETMEMVAEKRLMRPAYFEEAVTRAMRDPSGEQLFAWVYQNTVEQPDMDGLGDLATIFHHGLRVPEDLSSMKAKRWKEVWTVLQKNGYTPANTPTDVLGAIKGKGQKPEMQGSLDLLRASAVTR